ncbi:MAG TPA: L,D-transpeptidase family protein [Candidatus Nanopelagicales bacterium]|nr:L,D-transpeptidase family protein [Candidatus Nanopelagicales bacterium]
MNNLRRTLTAAALSAASILCSPAITADPGAPRKVTEIRIDKSDHTLTLVAGDDVVKTYKVAIGPGGAGPKRFEGDKRTPVGTYRVSSRIKGLFHRFLVVSYPNAEDVARYAELKRRGEVPEGRGVGHGIGIHGVGSKELSGAHKLTDWTLGCIALDDDEIDEVARLVPDGTRIVITD